MHEFDTKPTFVFNVIFWGVGACYWYILKWHVRWDNMAVNEPDSSVNFSTSISTNTGKQLPHSCRDISTWRSNQWKELLQWRDFTRLGNRGARLDCDLWSHVKTLIRLKRTPTWILLVVVECLAVGRGSSLNCPYFLIPLSDRPTKHTSSMYWNDLNCRDGQKYYSRMRKFYL